ncbi:hypothetical protein F511_01206 [Dorcoceras hygrometricum]|uniref:DUF6821 domain-containing protein n=1 Tax=Dorcoceras hygrometricum TaxID=472368 RepID=A0A2Z7BUJ0_9LAMI|nr:hypothetical protein F511_01206 [Dorcoceras hygrometricum]
MDIVEATNEFSDWELLQPSLDSEAIPVTPIDSVNSFDEMGSGRLIQANYFSLDALDRYGEDLDDNKSAESDNPSWIDPGFDGNPTRYLDRETAEFWSDSGSERSEDRKTKDSVGRNMTGFSEDENRHVGFDRVEEMVEQKVEKVENLGNSCSDSTGFEARSEKVNYFVENSDLGQEDNVILHDDTEEEKHESEVIGKGREVSDGNEMKSSEEIEKSCVVWWKMPLELLKYCVFKMSPVWTISAAAALLGFLILRRRLYTMTKKARGMEIKVTVDAKKASQVMSRAARLNEAFWVVKRVPVIRPSLPADGVTAWPAMAHLR